MSKQHTPFSVLKRVITVARVIKDLENTVGQATRQELMELISELAKDAESVVTPTDNAIVVLNDGETYSALKGSKILTLSESGLASLDRGDLPDVKKEDILQEIAL